MTTKHEKYHFSVFLLITHGFIKKIGSEKNSKNSAVGVGWL